MTTTKIITITIKTITPQIPIQPIKALQQEHLQPIKELQVQLLQQTKAQQAQEQQEVNLPELLLQAVMQKLVTRQVSGDGLVLQ